MEDRHAQLLLPSLDARPKSLTALHDLNEDTKTSGSQKNGMNSVRQFPTNYTRSSIHTDSTPRTETAEVPK